MRWCVCLCLCVLFSLSNTQNLGRETCDARRSEVDVEVASAGALIGGIFKIRDTLTGGYTCGTPHKELIQVYEAAKFAIQRVNAQNIVPGIRLGMKAYDDCGSPFMAVRAAQKFYPQFSNTQLSCSDGSKLHLGILGPLNSNTESVAQMTSDIPASQISPRIIHPDLSDKSMYPYFLRTGRNWFSFARVLTQVLKQMNWTRVTVVNVDTDMGELGYKEFSRQALNENICIAGLKTVSIVATQADYETQLSDLGNDGVNVAVFLGPGAHAIKLLKSNVGKRVQWVMADMLRMVSTDPLSVHAPNSKGVIFALPKVRQITEFENYFVTLSETSPPGDNPWFQDWYMTLYDCRLPGINYAPFATKLFCPQTVTKRSIYKQLPYVQSAIEGVYAYAKAFRTAHRTRCGDSFNGVCDSLRAMSTADFNTILKNIDFTFSNTDGIPSMAGRRVKFDANGDIINQDFTIYNYNDRTTAPNFAFEEVMLQLLYFKWHL
ncbi:metabotropic glutamate receptor 3-like [Saccostrea echinata]|uniref:metabotropic glutamate receptor 3-like n=1 Tax=Saccostrea echinata TaxID=191078 RepID=UPI002A82422A|nr:metabotropic glutamate receptor 3-like [Saccostrea echinata]